MTISIVIIAKNEAHIVANTLRSLQGLSDDIVVVDSGSTDGTQDICRNLGAQVITTAWLGYGPTKNIGIHAARHDWVLSLDADEAIDNTLYQAILQLPRASETTVYNIRFKNFFCGKWLRYGEWGTDKHIRLFNKKRVHWNDAPVHETLIFPEKITVAVLPGYVLHYTVSNLDQYISKTVQYARLNARKYANQGKNASRLKLYTSPFFTFLNNYVIRLGFLDGYEGYLTAKTTAWYTFLKYAYLRAIRRQTQNDSTTVT